MDFSKLKNLVKQNGDKFIVLENGEPELVVMSFAEYERLAKNISPTKFSITRVGWRDEYELPDLMTGFRETEFMAPAVAESIGLPVRLEDIRLEDLPI